jgi:hypothetical protein
VKKIAIGTPRFQSRFHRRRRDRRIFSVLAIRALSCATG